MRWLLIVLLSLLGVLLALLSIFGWVEGAMMLVIGIILWLIIAILIGRFANGKFFLHGFLTNLISTLLSSLLIYFFWDTYMANSTAMQERLTQGPEGINYRIITLATSPLVAGVYGAVLGLLSILGGKLFGVKKEETSAAEPPK